MHGIRRPQGPECHALSSQTENLPERPPGSLFGDNPSGWAFGRMGQIHMGRVNPFRALVAGLAADEFLPLREAVDERRCRSSGRRFTSPTGTVLEHCRKPLVTWVSFIRPMCHNVPVECAAELCGVTHKMAFEWRHRVLATVSGYQDRIVLRDTVWVDETYVNDTDISKGYGQARKRGLSSQRLCICVAIEIHKNPVAVGCGHGKPSSARARKAVSGSMAPGSLLIHDPERARGMLVRDGGLEKEVHRADVSDPV